MNTRWRIRWERRDGGYIHCSLFTKQIGGSWQKCGDFVVSEGREFDALQLSWDECEFLRKVE